MSKTSKTTDSELEEMARMGVWLGHLKAHSNPKMKQFIWLTKNNFRVIDLEMSRQSFESALNFLKTIKQKDGTILFVGTNIAAEEAVKSTAEALKAPYVIGRWLGGTLTNWQTINQRITYMKDLEAKKAAGEFEKYTKYEALKLGEKLQKLQTALGGLRTLLKLPDAIWVSSAVNDKIAVDEAKHKKIPVVGLVNTNGDPSDFDYPIPANDMSKNVINFMLGRIKDSLDHG